MMSMPYAASGLGGMLKHGRSKITFLVALAVALSRNAQLFWTIKSGNSGNPGNSGEAFSFSPPALAKDDSIIIPPVVAVFYNVYTGRNTAVLQRSLSIIQEQMQIWQDSILRHARLYYVLIGSKIEFPCPPNQSCMLLQHEEEGSEALTLHLLHEYCVENPLHRVLYIHNKGSFHDTEDNTLLRKLLTRAVFSDECAKSSDDECTVCSARFSPIPHWHSPGNMWLANCDYVKKLLPPAVFAERVPLLVLQVQDKTKEMGGPLLKKFSWTMPAECEAGINRFSNEHWIHTHPLSQPCDVYPGKYYWGYEGLAESENITNFT
jgi:hypothetical protein